jgi:hypothetical protein
MIKTKPPSDGRVSIKEVIAFMESCTIKLRDANEDDAAFYFEQIADYVRKNPHKGLQEDVGRILGL